MVDTIRSDEGENQAQERRMEGGQKGEQKRGRWLGHLGNTNLHKKHAFSTREPILADESDNGVLAEERLPKADIDRQLVDRVLHPPCAELCRLGKPVPS